jgi:CheY-like chemotaxis protein
MLTTTSTQGALPMLRTRAVDLLLLALAGSGEQLLRQLKDDPGLRHIPVLLVTGFDRETSAHILQRIGLDIDRDAAGYVGKSKDEFPRKLLDAIELVLVKHGTPLPAERARVRSGAPIRT